MSKRSKRKSKSTRPRVVCASPPDHDWERFLLDGAARMGTVANSANINVELCECGAVMGYWKIMRCGCTWLADTLHVPLVRL
jgi:hypothetical protein